MIVSRSWHCVVLFPVQSGRFQNLLSHTLTYRFRNLSLLLDWGLGALCHANHVTGSEAVRRKGLAAWLSEPHHMVAIEPPSSRGPTSLSHGRKAEAVALAMAESGVRVRMRSSQIVQYTRQCDPPPGASGGEHPRQEQCCCASVNVVSMVVHASEPPPFARSDGGGSGGRRRAAGTSYCTGGGQLVVIVPLAA